MKLIDLTCSKCGAQLKINSTLKKCMCQYCGNEMLIDDEVIHHNLENGFNFGYQAELGRIRAQQDAARKQEIDRQNRIIADRQRLLNTPRGQYYWRLLSKSFKRPLSDTEVEPYIRKTLLKDKILAYQYQNGINYLQQEKQEEQQEKIRNKTHSKLELSRDQYNKLCTLSIFSLILSIIPVISIIMSIIILCNVSSADDTYNLNTKITVISTISMVLCAISTGVLFLAIITP